MGSLHRSEAFPRARDLEGHALELFEVESRQCFEPLGTVFGEVQPDHPVVLFVPSAADKPGGVRPVDQADRAVMTKEQVVGHFPDSRTTRIAVAADGQQELVLRGGQPSGARLLLAPALKVA